MKNVILVQGSIGVNNTKMAKTVLMHSLLPSLIGVLAAAAVPAKAGELQSWQVEQSQNQLSVTGEVLPAAQLIADFDANSAQDWIAELPESPTPGAANGPIANANPGAGTLLQDIQVGDNGIVLRTSGQQPQVEVKRAIDRSWLTIDIPGARLSPDLQGRNRAVNRFGVQRLQATQLSSSPPVARVTLSMSDRGQNWEVRANQPGGVLLWPEGSRPPVIGQATGFASIQAVELRNNGTELVVKTDSPIAYTTGWDRQTAAYRITIYSAALPGNIRLPEPPAGSPILWVRERQDEPESVTLLVQIGSGVQVMNTTQDTPTQLSLKLQPAQAAQPGGSRPIPVPRPQPMPMPEPAPLPSQPPRLNDGRIVVVVDPGHGGSDPGAIGIGGLREKDVVSDISMQVSQILEQNGVQVVLTRRDDRTLELEPRTVLANRVNADLFVSIHANAAPGANPSANGVETFYYESGRVLADYIQRSIMESFDMRNRGVKRARFYVLRHTRMPAVLVEVGFVTGTEDARILADSGERTRMAQAIARGVLRYIQGNR
ncbi:N-acetylmuramoyl-L-alanine amidase [[Phormidium] sp. ETS-05]|uniref:N-acetylmuramoyl-L-alanine amidase family protein n=1 Tax=[Phormidium] sp. ETS-05 TaxID=222819 RepID=UPI001E5D6B03|nr:N-acetylmuramoyl-L-alanine amidase [[Phormidium] sp. ETS-05]